MLVVMRREVNLLGVRGVVINENGELKPAFVKTIARINSVTEAEIIAAALWHRTLPPREFGAGCYIF